MAAGGKASKNKGNNGERELCKLLGDIFESSFIRSPSSGAFVGGKNVHRKATLTTGQSQNLKGDIVVPDHMPHMVLECKSYADFRFHQLMMKGTCPQLDDWISQTLDVIDPTDEWFVVMKITRIGWLVALPASHSEHYEFGNYCSYTGKHATVRVTDLAEFFRANREAVLRRTAACPKPKPSKLAARPRKSAAPGKPTKAPSAEP